MTNWTKGPWFASATDDLMLWVSKDDADGEIIAQLDSVNPYDAHLIAAAPDLYEALDAMLSLWGSVMGAQGFDPDHVVEPAQARAALSKARGEQ